MIKYFLYTLIILLSGCTADFTVFEKAEEPVYIHFSTNTNIQVDVSEDTRGGIFEQEIPIGILGIGTQAEHLNWTTLAGRNAASLRQWMANDVYRLYDKNIEHSLGQHPSFPIEDSSAIVAYAYLPHTQHIVYDNDSCYIPIDLMADSATTDWMYTGRVAKTKTRYCEDPTFVFNFRHAMTRLDLVISPEIGANDTVEILEIDLGMYNHGKGRLLLEDGAVSLDTATCLPDSVYRLRRRKTDIEFPTQEKAQYTETLYLMPYTKIHDLRIVGVWNGADTLHYEHYIDTTLWNRANLHPGKRSVINIKSIRR